MADPFSGFVIGRSYRLHEEMWPSSPGFGAYFGGIQPKGRFPNTEAIVLLAEIEGGRYGNRWDSEYLVYQGEDDKWAPNPRTADQTLSRGNNRALNHQRESRIPLYLFTKNQGESRWIYQGLAGVEAAEETQRAGRTVVEFHLLPFGISATEGFTSAEMEFLAAEREPPVLRNGESKLTSSARKTRSAAFSARVRRAYEYRCAVCGKSRKDAWGRPEVDAAHIFPKEENGADDIRNGLALCSFHHWAFDGGLFLIDEDLIIRLTDPGEQSDELRPFDGRKLTVLPVVSEDHPHPTYVKARLKIRRFAGLRRKDN